MSIKNLGDKANTNGFRENPENAKKGGRKPSIKNALKKLLDSEGGMVIKKNQIIRVDEKTGDITISVPTEMKLAMKLVSIAMSNENKNIGTSTRAIQMMMEQLDGKPRQSIDLGIEDITLPPITFNIGYREPAEQPKSPLHIDSAKED